MSFYQVYLIVMLTATIVTVLLLRSSKRQFFKRVNRNLLTLIVAVLLGFSIVNLADSFVHVLPEKLLLTFNFSCFVLLILVGCYSMIRGLKEVRPSES